MSITVNPIAGTGDGGWRTGYFNTSSFTMGMGNVSGAFHSFFKFQLNVPQGAFIDTATLSVKACSSNSWTGSIHLKIYAEDVDDGAEPVDEAAADALTLTTAYGTWDPPDYTNNSWYTSDDFASVVQEIVDRIGWVSGNDILIVVKDNSSTADRYIDIHTANNASEEPILNVTYSTGVVSGTHSDSASIDDAISAFNLTDIVTDGVSIADTMIGGGDITAVIDPESVTIQDAFAGGFEYTYTLGESATTSEVFSATQEPYALINIVGIGESIEVLVQGSAGIAINTAPEFDLTAQAGLNGILDDEYAGISISIAAGLNFSAEMSKFGITGVGVTGAIGTLSISSPVFEVNTTHGGSAELTVPEFTIEATSLVGRTGIANLQFAMSLTSTGLTGAVGSSSLQYAKYSVIASGVSPIPGISTIVLGIASITAYGYTGMIGNLSESVTGFNETCTGYCNEAGTVYEDAPIFGVTAIGECVGRFTDYVLRYTRSS